MGKWNITEEKKEKWLNYLALTTVIFAVCATLSTLKGGNFSTRAVMSQSQASDRWAYYQSKSIKEYIYDIQKEKLELELKALGPRAQKQVVEEYEKKVESYSNKVKKYEEEKAKIEKDVKALEDIRDEAQLHSKAFGMAVIFLQIAILLSIHLCSDEKKALMDAGACCRCLWACLFRERLYAFHEVSRGTSYPEGKLPLCRKFI